jgi:hypothetical protein
MDAQDGIERLQLSAPVPIVCLLTGPPWLPLQVVVSSMREAQELLRKAAKARQSSGTNANERSSRSHAVITVRTCLWCSQCGCDKLMPHCVLS